MPVVIGAGGVERIVEIALDPAEKAAFDKSCDAVRDLIAASKQAGRLMPQAVTASEVLP